MPGFYLYLVLGACLLVMIPILGRSGALKNLLPSSACGLFGLLAVNFAGSFGPALLSVNLFTVAASLLLGLPGVVGMLLLRLIVVI